jgi:uncharacterized protein (DUF934 family)
MAKQFIINRTISDNNWQYISSDEFNPSELPDSNLFLDYVLWQEQHQQLSHACAPTLGADIEIDAIAKELIKQEDIGLYFKTLKSGRGYSYARILREDYNYTGNLHALGIVSRDHLCFMERCGINAFHLMEESNLESALEYFADIEVIYQR